MIRTDKTESGGLLLLVAGAKGAIGSTLAAAVAVMQRDLAPVLPSLTTGHLFSFLGPLQATRMVGWDKADGSVTEAIQRHGVIPESLWKPHAQELDSMTVLRAPAPTADLPTQVEQIVRDITGLKSQHGPARAVFVNLLPAAAYRNLGGCRNLSQLYEQAAAGFIPDLAYALAAVAAGLPVVNFTPNTVEIPVLLDEAVQRGVPLAGRDGKTGQTYFKIVLASALKARHLKIDGWYSLNILGNADGANLMDPERAAEKLSNKTNLLDEILGYTIGENYPAPSHKVHIDYYPPRGDAKEAWDVIDFKGMFGLPMSIRLNLQGRDSVLAAPLVLDLARWTAALQAAGRCGAVPELGFYFKKPVGESAPLTFQDQLTSLARLKCECREKIAAGSQG
jgi:myo-inositol-1-phosphate synthase